MSNLYHASSSRSRGPSSPFGRIAVRSVGLLLAIGVCVGAVFAFRKMGGQEEATAPEDSAEAMAMAAVAVHYDATSTLASVNGAAATGNATRSHTNDVYSMQIVAELPPIDGATTAYEAWYVKPGITDFFSLGEAYPREDGKWGLAWSQTDALVRYDIEEFNRVIVIREPRDGNVAPSADQVLTGGF